MLRKYGSKLKIAAYSLALEDVVSETFPSSNYKKIENKSNEFLYFRARAISAGDQGPKKGEPNPNGNGDYFPRKELEASFETFNGRNLFLNHDSDHPIKSIGKILDAYEVEDPETGEYYIECLAKIDRKLHPEMARKVETGELNTVSMGCSCEASKCSICGKTVYTDDDVKCAHIEPSGILKKYTAEVDIPEYRIRKGQETLAFSINTGLVFNELSIVNVPADEDAFIKTIIASNLKTKINKKAKLDETETKHLQILLNALDEPSKKAIQAEFCACEIPKEDKSMSDKKSEKDQKRDPEIEKILAKLNGLEYIEFMNYAEAKMDKESKRAEKEEILVKKSDNKISSAIEKVKKSFIGRLFSKAVKEELGEVKKTEHKAAKIAPIEITAKFTKADKFEDSYWTVYKGKRQVLRAHVKNLWDKEQLADKKYQDWTQSENYGKKLVSTYKKLGFLKTAKLLGLGFKTMDIKDSKVKMPAKKDFVKPGEKSKADKEHEKSDKAVEKAYEVKPATEEMKEKEKKDMDVKKEKKEAKNDKKADELIEPIDEMEPVVEEPKSEEEKLEEVPKEEAPVNEESVDEEPKSAFDKLDDKLIISESLEAYKDKETNEIVIVDAAGTEVKRMEDGFGDDVPAVLKLLQDIMGVSQEQEEKPALEAPVEEIPKPEEAPIGEPKEEPKEEVKEEVPMAASKKEKVIKKATNEQSKLFAKAVNDRMDKVKTIVESMVDKEMVKFKEEDVEAELKKGSTLLGARDVAMKKAIDQQVKLLIAMDDKALINFKASVDNVQIQKEASNKLTSPIHLGYKPSNMDSDIGSIFDSMGNGGK